MADPLPPTVVRAMRALADARDDAGLCGFSMTCANRRAPGRVGCQPCLDRAHRPNRGIYRCSRCAKYGHTAARCPKKRAAQAPRVDHIEKGGSQ